MATLFRKELSMKEKKKRKWQNRILTILLVILVILIINSAVHIYLWYQDNKKIDKQIEAIQELITIEEVEEKENIEIINPPEDQSDPYWDYIKMNLIDVDFSSLKDINSDVVGWILVEGTNVNYPFVQTTNNSYYLTHQLDKTYNSAGWVFMDYRNSIESFDQNTILYAHGRVNNTMFGSLRSVIKKEWYSNPSNHILKLSTENENTLWQVFSTYRIKTTNDYLQTSFESDDSYLAFLTMLKERSVYDYPVNLTKDDIIITLSTCYNNTDKIVLHAKLIKREKKEL